MKGVTEYDDVIHIYPIDSSLPHNTSGLECWCKPQYEEVRNGLIVIHEELQEQ